MDSIVMITFLISNVVLTAPQCCFRTFLIISVNQYWVPFFFPLTNIEWQFPFRWPLLSDVFLSVNHVLGDTFCSVNHVLGDVFLSVNQYWEGGFCQEFWKYSIFSKNKKFSDLSPMTPECAAKTTHYINFFYSLTGSL